MSTPRLVRYGAGPDRIVERWTPVGPPPADGWPVVVLIHGGYWRQRYDRGLMRPLAQDLVARGVVVWNVEYRRVGGSGGWPWTVEDVRSSIDLLVGPVGDDIDRRRVGVVGHSAGGHLALWFAGMTGARDDVRGTHDAPRTGIRPAAVVGLAPVADLARAARDGLSTGAATALMRCAPGQDPLRWEAADPCRHARHGIATLLVHGRKDEDVPIGQSEAYLAAARAAGTPITCQWDDSDHFACIDPSSATWARARTWLLAQLQVPD